MKFFLAAIFSLFAFNLSTHAEEADFSPWAQSYNTSMRLIAGGNLQDTHVLHAGIEIRLAPNFKTYWRTPGESGVAPVVSFEGSENLKTAKVLFPAPHVFKDKTGSIIGYKDHVIWPVHVEAHDIAKPVLLNVKLEYGVCEKICIPASGTAKISLSGEKKTEFEAQIKAAEARVPQKMKTGEGKGISITKISEPATEKNHAAFTVDVAGSKPLELLAEAMPDSWYLEVQTVNNIDNQFKIIVFDPQSAQSRIPCDIVLTAMNQSKAIEVPVRLAGCIEH